MTAHSDTLAMANMLVVDCDSHPFEMIKKQFIKDTAIHHARSAKDAYSILAANNIGIIICSEYLEDEHGLQFMARIDKKFPTLQTILMSEGIDEDLLEIAINEVGVLKYLKKPFNSTQVKEALISANQHYLQAVETENLKKNYSKTLKEMNSVPYMARRARQTTRIMLHNANDLTAAAGVSVAIILATFFILGVMVFMGLYIIKSLFGINLFADAHLSDVLGHFI